MSSNKNSIFIGKLSGRMRTHELEDEFNRFGRIRDIDFRKVTKNNHFNFIFFTNMIYIIFLFRKEDSHSSNFPTLMLPEKPSEKWTKESSTVIES